MGVLPARVREPVRHTSVRYARRVLCICRTRGGGGVWCWATVTGLTCRRRGRQPIMTFRPTHYRLTTAAFGVALALALTSCGTAQDAGGSSEPATATVVDSALTRIKEAGTLRVCSTGDYPPFTEQTESGDWKGIDVDMARDLAETMGVEPSGHPTDSEGVLQRVERSRQIAEVLARPKEGHLPYGLRRMPNCRLHAGRHIRAVADHAPGASPRSAQAHSRHG
ncbi:transporter substrate-binding domain-containing protein [Micrococcus luteus]|uniref:transporter substrate-binding domain-containing protein n=1 Tax=Micrococcus luteus TaxID=1270 RepID=UPI003672FF93